MNMLLGVLCEVISAVASREREEIKFANVGDRLREIAIALELPDRVSPSDFWEIMRSKKAARAFADVGVDVESVVDLAELMFFKEDGTYTDLTFDGFLDKVFELRYENPATLRDIKFLWTHITPNLDK